MGSFKVLCNIELQLIVLLLQLVHIPLQHFFHNIYSPVMNNRIWSLMLFMIWLWIFCIINENTSLCPTLIAHWVCWNLSTFLYFCIIIRICISRLFIEYLESMCSSCLSCFLKNCMCSLISFIFSSQAVSASLNYCSLQAFTFNTIRQVLKKHYNSNFLDHLIPWSKVQLLVSFLLTFY